MITRLLRRSAAFFALAIAACSQGTPVAPTGSVLHLSVYPTRVAKTGTATITAQLYRVNGNPVNPGTEIRLSSDIGIVDPVIYTDNDGIATGHIRGDGSRVGTATISAFSGSVAAVTATVAIGQLGASLSLQLTPAAISQDGGTLSILALVRDDQGLALPDAEVNFTTQVGTLASGGTFVTTDSGGAARDTLIVVASDLQGIGGNGFDVTAEVGGTGGNVIAKTFTVSIQRPPLASFTFQVTGLTVSFQDTSTGTPTAWLWDFGDGTPSSSQRNPVHIYGAPGVYVVTLTVRNAVGSDTTSNVVHINQ